MTDEDWRTQEPLKEKIGCSSTRCDKGLHCFRRQFKKQRRLPSQTYRNGTCYKCGADLIDWERLDKKDLKDVEYTFTSLQHEMIRHHFWHINIDAKTVSKARRAGMLKIKTQLYNRLEKTLKPPHKEIWHDGYQTAYSGDIIFYAQHSTSTCCRNCIEEWYGIDRNRSLTDDEVNYFAELIMRYIRYRLPDLADEGIKIMG
jgi:hypothetical protein